jgi:hypothetical protein
MRNHLARHYFRDKAVYFMKKDGCQNMLDELDSFISKLEDGDRKIDSITSIIREQYGVTNEMIIKIEKDLL